MAVFSYLIKTFSFTECIRILLIRKYLGCPYVCVYACVSVGRCDCGQLYTETSNVNKILHKQCPTGLAVVCA